MLYLFTIQINHSMKKILFIISVTIATVIAFYPTISNSNTAGSIGGKTGSPTDGVSCTQCHYAGQIDEGGFIWTDIPASGYIPGETYTITAGAIEGSNPTNTSKFGFEITSEEANFGSSKTGNFIITNNTETKLINNNTAITHKIGGTSVTIDPTTGAASRTWSMDWQAPSSGTGDVTFYAAFIGGNGDGTNAGDNYDDYQITVSEGMNTAIHYNTNQNLILFNSITKTIELNDQTSTSIYNINGQLIFSSTEKKIDVSHLSQGNYIVKSANQTKKITIK